MSKYTLLAVLFIYLFLYSVIANSLGLDASDIVTDVGSIGTPTSTAGFFEFTIDTFVMLAKLISFNVSGIPTLLIILTIHTPALVLIFIIVALVRGV